MLFFCFDSVWSWLTPCLHEEIMAGAYLALLHRFNPRGYVVQVVDRVAKLLQKQAKLLAPKGVQVQLPQEP